MFPSGSFELQMNSFGGRFGKDGNTPIDEFLDDDGISHIVEGGLKLKVDYEMNVEIIHVNYTLPLCSKCMKKSRQTM